jgi:hypothetical protein
VSQAGRDAIAPNEHRNSIVPSSGASAPTATSAELTAAVAQNRAKHLALMLMAASAVVVLGGILWLLWRLA